MTTDTRETSPEAAKARTAQAVAAAIRAATRSNVRDALEGLITGYQPLDIADAMREWESDEREAVFALLDADASGVVLEEVDDEIGADLAEATPDAELAEIIDAMPPDVGSDVVNLLDHERQHRVLDRIPDEEADELKQLMEFPVDTAGGLMTTDLLMAPADLTAADVRTHIQRQDIPPDTLTYVYVIDEARRLLGVIDMAELLTAAPEARLRDFMVTDVVSVGPETDREEVVRLVDKYDLLGLPVADDDTRLLGMVTVDDVIDAMQKEHSEDISQFAGTSAEALESASSLRVARLRLPWLALSLLGTFLAAGVIRLFSGPLQAVIGLAAFIPVIMAMSGNSGLQTATIVVRGMALGVIEQGAIGRLLLREVVTALVIGVVCGVLAGALGMAFMNDVGFGPLVALAMTLAVMWSSMVGTAIPFAFQRLGIDPAIASGPLVTTINDCFALLIYFGVATVMLAVFPGLLG
jgi:magnesium transporter